MSYQETSTTGYGERLGNSLKGIVIGFGLFIAGTVVLFWNEGNFVKEQKALKEGEKNVISITDINTVNPEFNGKLIHASGFADTKDSLSDEIFGVKENAIALYRNVEYYQWVEESKTESKDKIGGSEEKTTTYTYQQEWVNEPVNSAKFKDPAYQGKNTILYTVEDKSWEAKNVTFGAYSLPVFIIKDISGETPVKINLTDDQKKEWETAIRKNVENVASDTNNVEYLHITENVAFFGQSPTNPKIGDVRVTVVKTEPTNISIIAKTIGSTFEPYISKNGRNISQIQNGTVSADSMFEAAHESNSIITWVLRVVGVFCIIAGLKSMFSIAETLFKVLPFLANIVGAGIGLVVFVGGLAWSILVIAIAWLFYRPLIAILLIAAVGGLIYYLRKRAKDKAALKNETTL